MTNRKPVTTKPLITVTSVILLVTHNRLVNGSGSTADIINDYATGVGRAAI